MNYSISSLANMERNLYGGTSLYSNAPSYSNNYQMPMNYNTNYYGGNVPNQTIFGQQIPPYYTNAMQNYGYPQIQTNQIQNQTQANALQNNYQLTQPQNTNTTPQTQAKSQPSQTIFGNLTQTQKDAVVDFYAKNLEPSESFKNAVLLGGISCGLMQNPRVIAHPINYLTTTLGMGKNPIVKEMFKDVKVEGSALNKLWKKNNMILEDAFSQMHRAEARSKSRLTNLYRTRYTTTEIEKLKGIMQTALKKGDLDEIAKATEALRHAYCRNGKILKAYHWCKEKLGLKNNLKSVDKMLADTKTISETAQRMASYNKNMTPWKAFQKTNGIFGALMGLTEIVMNWSKVKTAQAKDAENAEKGIYTEYGKKQKTQTITKGITNTIGWCIGESLSVLAWSKVGATVGTAIGPGIGTAIGAIIGFLGGSLGMWLAGKGTKAIVGEDVANRIEAENKAKTPEGQLELIQTTAEAMQKGEKVNPFAQQAVNQILTTYA
ncbi:hypothetical protein IJD34_04250 [bacterium]|nr:hypothetical protein [bacterium]